VIDEEPGWHPDGADLSRLALAGLLALLAVPVLLAVLIIATLR
jgi:hypothetical protein